MTHIKQLAQFIEEELCDARKYACKAAEYRQTNQCLSKLYLDLSKAQMQHADKEYKMITQLMTQTYDTIK